MRKQQQQQHTYIHTFLGYRDGNIPVTSVSP